MNRKEHFESLQWSYGDLTQALKNMANGKLSTLSSLPARIQLSDPQRAHSIGATCDQMLAETMADPEKRERAKILVLSLNGHLELRYETVGSINDVPEQEIPLRVRINPYTGATYSEKVIATIHTHGIDVPPSSSDFANLLSQKNPDCVAMIAVTPTTRFLILRTQATTLQPTAAIEQWAQSWKNQLSEIFENLTSSKEVLVYLLTGKTDYRWHAPQEQMRFVEETCRTFHLALYVAVGNNDFHRLHQ